MSAINVASDGLSEATVHRLGAGVRQVTLADAIGIEGPSLVRLLDQLCAAGLLERREDSTDRRAKTVVLVLSAVAPHAAIWLERDRSCKVRWLDC